MQKKYYTYLFSFGHFCSDINQTALSALLPFLIAAYKFDYTTAAFLVMAANIIGCLVQPFLGQLADKKNWPWVMALGLFLAGGGMAVTGLIPSFSGLCIAVMISGIGIAMFHPQAAKLVNHASSDANKGMSLSIFSFGGSLGSTLGPIVITGAITQFGIKGTLVFFIPELIVCTLIGLSYRNLVALGSKTNIQASDGIAKSEIVTQEDTWSGFARLSAVMFGRSVVYYGLNTFLVLFWIQILRQTESVGNTMLSFYYGFGALCTLLGGKLADKYGYRFIIKIGFAILLPSIFLLALTNNFYIATVLLLPMGAAIQIVYSPMVVLGQQYLPNHVGLASGVTLGLAVSVGGLFAPILGKVADTFGLIITMYVIAAIAVIPLLASFTLPKEKYE